MKTYNGYTEKQLDKIAREKLPNPTGIDEYWDYYQGCWIGDKYYYLKSLNLLPESNPLNNAPVS
jgi:hypothetical protein